MSNQNTKIKQSVWAVEVDYREGNGWETINAGISRSDAREIAALCRAKNNKTGLINKTRIVRFDRAE